MKKDLPIFDIIINDEDLSQGVGRISLVDEPAIGVDWIALKKQPKMIMAKKAVRSVLAKRECLGCPPNGDGTRANGEPDRRCKDTKGEGAAPKASTRGPGKAVAKGSGKSTSSVEKTPPLNVPISVQSLAPASTWNDETVAYWSDQKNVDAVDAKNEELKIREKDIIDRAAAFNKDLEKYPRNPNGTYNIPASERAAFVDRQRALNADKNALDKEVQDMFRVNSVVKSVKEAGGSSSLKTIEEKNTKAREAANKVTKSEERAAKAAQKRIEDPTFDKPPTARDYAQAEVVKAAADYERALGLYQKGEIPQWQLNTAKNSYEGRKNGSPSPREIKKANDDYNSLLERETGFLPPVYDRNRDRVPNGTARRDDTWDYKTGQPTAAPRGKKRKVVYERRSGDDINEGYDAYKIEVRWE